MFENVDIMLSLMLSVAPVILALAEHFIGKCRPLFLVLNALYMAFACVFLLAQEGTLAGLLIVVCIALAVRLFLEILKGREER